MIRKQKESIKELKPNEREQKIEIIVEDIDFGRIFELETSNKIYFNSLNLKEKKRKFYKITQFYRFKNMADFENYINAIDVDYDSEDVTSTGHVYKSNTPQFKFVKRSAYA